MTGTPERKLNGIDVDELRGRIAEIAEDPSKGALRFAARTSWRGGAKGETQVESCDVGGTRVTRSFSFASDEPSELFGGNASPSPVEYLMGALNSCMLFGWVAGAALRGVAIHELSIESEGRLDLRGFFGVGTSVAPGCESVRYVVRIRADATPEQLAEIHEAVRRTSPNFFNLAHPIHLEGKLEVG